MTDLVHDRKTAPAHDDSSQSQWLSELQAPPLSKLQSRQSPWHQELTGSPEVSGDIQDRLKAPHTFKDGDAVVITFPDGITQVDRISTGHHLVRIPSSDGGFFEHHWGPQAFMVYDRTFSNRDGADTTEDRFGNRVTMWPDGVIQVKNIDQTGLVSKPLGQGLFLQHSWGPKATDNKNSIVHVRRLDASQAFTDQVEDAYIKLPLFAKTVLNQKGINIFVDRERERFTGFGSDFGDTGGAYLFATKQIYISETPSVGNGVNSDPEAMVRHEVGHALDDAMGMLSESAAFKKAYEDDVSSFNDNGAAYFSELMPGAPMARAQLFAELFSALTAGSTPTRQFTKDVGEQFVESAKVVQKYIDGWKAGSLSVPAQ